MEEEIPKASGTDSRLTATMGGGSMNRRRKAPFSTRPGGRRVYRGWRGEQTFAENVGDETQLSFTHRSEKPSDLLML